MLGNTAQSLASQPNISPLCCALGCPRPAAWEPDTHAFPAGRGRHMQTPKMRVGGTRWQFQNASALPGSRWQGPGLLRASQGAKALTQGAGGPGCLLQSQEATRMLPARQRVGCSGCDCPHLQPSRPRASCSLAACRCPSVLWPPRPPRAGLPGASGAGGRPLCQPGGRGKCYFCLLCSSGTGSPGRGARGGRGSSAPPTGSF